MRFIALLSVLTILLVALVPLPSTASTLCTFGGVDYAMINAGSALRKTVGIYTYFISPCVDRLRDVSGGATDCGGASVCQVGTTNSGSWTLAYISSTPTFSRVNSTAVKSVQTGSGIDCGPVRITTILYVCAGYTTIASVIEPSPCVYTITVYTPLACPSSDTSWCLFQGIDFATVGASSYSQALTVLTGRSSSGVVLQVSPCTDRINVLQRNSSLDGVAMCRYATNGSACLPLMQVANTITWMRYSGPIFSAVTYTYNVGGCSSWVTSLRFYCGNTTSVVDVSESKCVSLLTISTPIVCAVIPPLSSSAPPLPRPPSSTAGGASPANKGEVPAMSTVMLIMIITVTCVGVVLAVFVILSCRRRLSAQHAAVVMAVGGGGEASAARAEGNEHAFRYQLHVEGVASSASGGGNGRQASASMELQNYATYAYEPNRA